MNTRTLIVGLFSLVGMASINAQAGSASWCSPDTYGHVLCDSTPATTDAVIEPGKGDQYGSVLLDSPSKATTDAFVERGVGDLYGSVLLDVGAPSNRAQHKVVRK
jgi:hypothetical protein